MANQTVNNVTFQIRRDTAQGWAVANPVLAEGELGFETDTGKSKCGDGTTTWNNLGYLYALPTHTHTTAWADITGKPTFATVATSGSYNDLTDKPAISTGGGIPVGFEYFSPNPNIPQGSLPLFGGEYSRSIYSDLWDWVQTQTGYCKTEAEWQTLSSVQNGNVPYYSDGDGSTTFRVPSLKCWVKGANGTVTEVGSYKAAGLPNITGALTPNDTTSSSVDIDFTGTGAVRATNATRPSGSTGTNNWNTWAGFNFDASRSSSIYGNSTTVQPESIVGMWLVKAYGTIVDTGQINEQQYIDLQLLQYLPLSGGTMTGNIAWNNGDVVAKFDSNNKLVFPDGTTVWIA